MVEDAAYFREKDSPETDRFRALLKGLGSKVLGICLFPLKQVEKARQPLSQRKKL